MMQSYPALVHAFNSTALAMLPEKAEEIRALLLARLRGEQVSEDRVEQVVANRRNPSDLLVAGARPTHHGTGVQVAKGGIALMPIFGTIAQRVGPIERASGGISTEEVGIALDGLMADQAIEQIVLVFDSPGGSVSGVIELADKINRAKSRKPITGIADSMAASAAYWLASQCSEVCITPGGTMGSIGVLAMHIDYSEADKQAGVKTTYVTSSPYKAERAPEYPLSLEARAELQARVDEFHGLFIRAVARGRNSTATKVSQGFGQGRMVTAKDAVARGMADRVTTLEALVRKLASGGNSSEAAQARARVMEMQEENDRRPPLHPAAAVADAKVRVMEMESADDPTPVRRGHAAPTRRGPLTPAEARRIAYDMESN